jgi:formate hydrogenlyase subunit 4
MNTSTLRTIVSLGLSAMPAMALAATVPVETASAVATASEMESFWRYLAYLVGFVSILLFLSGSLFVIVSIGKPDQMEKGRKFFLHSIKGMVVLVVVYVVARVGFTLLGQ